MNHREVNATICCEIKINLFLNGEKFKGNHNILLERYMSLTKFQIF